MAIVTVVDGVSESPMRAEVAQKAVDLLPKLFDMWFRHHGTFIAGTRFAILAYPPAAYPPMKDGPIQDGSAMMRAPLAVAFSMSDDPAAEGSRFCLKIWEPNPNFTPDGVASYDPSVSTTLVVVDEQGLPDA